MKTTMLLAVLCAIGVSSEMYAGQSAPSYLEMGKITGMSVVAACCYGVLHDLVTANLSKEYFLPPHHPQIYNFDEKTPTPLIAAGWGIEGTWRVGLLWGIPLAMVSQYGSHAKRTASMLIPLVGKVLLKTGVLAGVTGLCGLFANRKEKKKDRNFRTVAMMHTASYAGAFLFGLDGLARAIAERIDAA